MTDASLKKTGRGGGEPYVRIAAVVLMARAAGLVSAVEVGDCFVTQRVDPGSAPNVTFEAKTTAATALPAELPTPTFWLDCSHTNGWLFDGSRVTGIVSRVGSRRLVTGKPSANWGANAAKWSVTGAVFVTGVPALNGGAMLDFGTVQMGTAKSSGFIFDESDDPVFVNRLPNVRTAIAVYNSENGGGWFLSGGGTTNSMNETGFLRSSVSTWYSPSVQEHQVAALSVREGIFRHDGLPTKPLRIGYNGGWETVSYMARTYTPASDTAAYDYAYATGVGVNDTRWNFDAAYAHGGGMRIAELIVFGDKLTHAQCAEVENYLKAKWFGRSERGYNGNAAVSTIRVYRGAMRPTAARIEAKAAAGETLAIDRIYGGRDNRYQNTIDGAPGIDKTGAGTLAVGDFTEFCGEIRVLEGSLAFRRRPVPSALPAHPFVRFDASDASTLTVGSDGRVTAWRNAETLTGEAWQLGGNAAREVYPTLRADVFGTGMPTLDFGPASLTEGANYAVRKGDGTDGYFRYITTVIAVIGVQEGGGHLAGGGAFTRGSSDALPYTMAPVYNATVYNVAPDTYTVGDGTFYLDGVKQTASTGYGHPGYHVVALQIPGGSSISAIGYRGDGDLSGGLRLSEFVAYNRVLSEEEIRDASAYLMDKWLGRTAPGYQPKTDAGAIDVQEIRWDNMLGGDIDVPEGATVRVNKFSISGPMRKTGAGTLVLAGGSRDAGDYVSVAGGKIVYEHPDPSASCEMAAAPAFHLDASDRVRMDVVTDATNAERVAFWYGRDYRNFVFQKTADRRPYLRTDALNGRSVVDFGPCVAYGTGCFMNFGVPMEAIRCVFAVWKASAAGGVLLGSSNENGWQTTQNVYDFIRGSAGQLFLDNVSMRNVDYGSIYVNGVKKNPDCVPAGTSYEILDVQTLYGGAHASALGADRNGVLQATQGGQSYAEIIIYTRTLTDRERVATRNYLRKKWFPDAALEDLPADASTDSQPNGIVRIAEIDADAQASLAVTGRTEAKRISGEGDFAKTGAGTLAIGDLGSYAGILSVREGTLALTGAEPTDGGTFVADGRVFHADATAGLELESSDGMTNVVKWTSRHDAAWTAEPGYADKFPTLRAYGTGTLHVVDMAADADQCLRFRHNGALATLDDVKSVFWAVGSQNGGGRLLGGGTNATHNANNNFNFHRGVAPSGLALDPASPLLHNYHADANLRNAAWRVNGTKVSPTSVGLSGDWDVVSMVTRNESEYSQAEGFAFDGRTFSQAGVNDAMVNVCKPYVGCQRLAEVIIYNRCLTSDECAQNENYLRRKWGIGMRAAKTNAASVDLAAGTGLDCGGTAQYVAALTGCGVVSNGTLETGCLVADYGASAWNEVRGTFAIAENLAVDVRNVPAGVLATAKHIRIPVLKAASFAELDRLDKATLTGVELPPNARARLKVTSAGWLVLQIDRVGMTIIFR